MISFALPLVRSLICIVLLMLFLHPRRRGFRLLAGLRRRIDHLARHRVLCVGLVGGLAMVLAMLLSWIEPPIPTVHDEYSYLLAADTFAQGRATNPPHELWRFFETFQVIHQPTYASKYPPAQGVALALGGALTGNPLVGVWVSCSLACAAITWMFQQWVSPRWALWGGLLTVVQLVLLGNPVPEQWPIGYWSQSYWGGAVAAFGGALVFGTARTLATQPQATRAVIMGLGLIILANSRPFEGLISTLPVAFLLIVQIIRRRFPWRSSLLRLVLPALLVLIPGAVTLGWYNHRVTGNPFLMPFEAHERAYGILPLFLWQPLRTPPAQEYPLIEEFYQGPMRDYYARQQTLVGFLQEVGRKGTILWAYYVGPWLTPLFVSLPWVVRQRWLGFVALIVFGLLLAMLATPPLFPHYVAPAASLILLLLTVSLRHQRLWLWRRRRQKAKVQSLLRAAVLILVPLPLVAGIYRMNLPRPMGWGKERLEIQDRLKAQGGRHLVLVRYGERHNPHLEWVYNAADIDGAPVIWARDRGREKNRELVDYYRDHQPDRQLWQLSDAVQPVRLETYK